MAQGALDKHGLTRSECKKGVVDVCKLRRRKYIREMVEGGGQGRSVWIGGRGSLIDLVALFACLRAAAVQKTATATVLFLHNCQYEPPLLHHPPSTGTTGTTCSLPRGNKNETINTGFIGAEQKTWERLF